MNSVSTSCPNSIRRFCFGRIFQITTSLNLRKLIDEYLLDGDGNKFIERTLLAHPKPNKMADKIKFLIVGNRHHQWMYDGPSMALLLSSMGFLKPRILPPGATIIPDPGELPLKERADESVYLEAQSP